MTKTAEQLKAEIAALQEQLSKVEDNEKEQKLKEANKKIAELVAQAETALSEAQAIADINEISFSWDGPGYGMGGWYTSGEWQSSSSSC